jgi:WS/DGAT/MGAT family acyltransferase
MDWLTPEDASFLHVEDDTHHMYGCTTIIFEGPIPTDEEIRALVESRLYQVPRFRQKIKEVPLHLGRPVWVDDEHFNLAYHLRRTALPAPGGDAELRKLKSRIQSQKMDRTKPLWEWWIVEGLEHGRWAIMHKTHHCIVDGVGNIDLLSLVFDTSPDAPPPEPARPWYPQREPSDSELVTEALKVGLTSPYEAGRRVLNAVRAPRRNWDRATELMRGAASMTNLVKSTAPTLNAPLTPHRTWTWTRTSMTDVKAVRRVLGGTVNDIVLANVTRGYRDLLVSRGVDVTGRVVRVMVPVSVRTGDSPEATSNAVSAVFADLPVGLDDPVERLNAVRAQMDGLKESKQAVAGEALTRLSGFAPPMLVAQAARLFRHVPINSINAVVTNVPGPRVPLYYLGRKMIDALPCLMLGTTMTTSIAIYSYLDHLTYAIIADLDATPDIEVLADGIAAGMVELAAAAGLEDRDGAKARPSKRKA